jgi:hypothetical protein
MGVVRRVVFWALFGGLAGTWAAGLVARAWVPWYHTPGSGIRSQCDCEPLTISTIGNTLGIMATGLVIGTIVFAVLAIVLGAGRKKKVEPSAPSTPPAAAA